MINPKRYLAPEYILYLGVIGISSPLSVLPSMAVRLTAATIAIIIIIMVVNITIANAQQQQLQIPPISQPSSTAGTTTTTLQNAATLFQSTEDSFRLQVPRGWVIHDIDNTGSALLTELMQGYGILAQLCPEGQQQQEVRHVSNNCQDSGQEIIHIIRYPNLSARLGIASDHDIFTIINRNTIPNTLLEYHIQKLNDVGYRDVQIINSTDTTVNVIIGRSLNNSNNNALATTKVPAKLVEVTYTTNSAPNEIRTGYFMLTAATATTPHNLGMITGYCIFYEGRSSPAKTATTPASSSLAASPSSSPTTTTLPPAPVRQVFDSFQLISTEALTEPLVVRITSSDTEGDVAPATFEFRANVTGGTEPYSFSWNFGDGREERGNGDETVRHTFDQAGTYNVHVIVTDSTGRTAFDNIEINVKEASVTEQPRDVQNFLNDLFNRLELR